MDRAPSSESGDQASTGGKDFFHLDDDKSRWRYMLLSFLLVGILNFIKNLVHELGHCVIIILFGGEIDGFNIFLTHGEVIWNRDSISPVYHPWVHLGGLFGELVLFYPAGLILFIGCRRRRHGRMTGYWILMLSITAAFYWAACPFICWNPGFDPLAFCGSLGIDRRRFGAIMMLPFGLSVLLGYLLTKKVKKDILIDPRNIHGLTVGIAFLAIGLTVNVV